MSGSAVTLALSGVRPADVMGQIGWRTGMTALHYLKLSEVLRVGGPSQVLFTCDPDQQFADDYFSLNTQKRFSDAFPSVIPDNS